MKRFVIVENGEIVNTIIWDGETPFDPQGGVTIMSEKEAKKRELPMADRDRLEVEKTREERLRPAKIEKESKA